MTLFTDSPYEKMMIRKPEDGKRDKSPPASFPPRTASNLLQNDRQIVVMCIIITHIIE